MSRYSELIYLYLDGEATPEEQQELFEALSRDEELQREFRQAIELYRAIDYERAATTVPAEIKDAVYAAIGITPTLSPVRQWLQRVGAVAGLGGMAVAVYLWLSTPASSPVKQPPRASAVAPAAVTTVQPQLPSPPAVAPPRPVQPPTLQPLEAPTATPEAESTLSDDEPVQFSRQRTVPIGAVDPFQRSMGFRPSMVVVPIAHRASSELAPFNVQATYRGSLLTASGANATLQNFSVVGLYRFDEHHHLGIELRRAPYTINIAQPSRALSTVVLTSVGAVYMFTEPKVRLLGGMPYFQTALGLTQLGPLASLGAGMSFPISNGFHLNVGFDGSALLYSSQVTANLGVAVGFTAALPIR